MPWIFCELLPSRGILSKKVIMKKQKALHQVKGFLSYLFSTCALSRNRVGIKIMPEIPTKL